MIKLLGFVSLSILALALPSLPAIAQEAGPGSACAPEENGNYRFAGGSANGGEGYFLSCNGTEWVRVYSFDTTGVFQPGFVNQGACEDGAAIVYHTATGGMSCGDAPPPDPGGGDGFQEPPPPPFVTCSAHNLVWTTHSPANGNNYHSVTFGLNMFVAASTNGSNNRIMTSPDGITWTERAANLSPGNLVYGHGRFVGAGIYGSSDTIVSEDGITWNQHNGVLPNARWTLGFGNGQFLALTHQGTSQVATSADGITWSSQNIQATVPNGRWTKIAYGDDRYAATCGHCYSDTDTYGVMTSTDGLSWTQHPATAGHGGWTILHDGTRFFGGTGWRNASRVITSDDGITWNYPGHTGSDPWFNALAYGPNIGYVGVNEGGTIFTSTNGSSWSNRAPPAGVSSYSYPDSITYGNGIFIVLANSGNLVMRGECPPE